MKCNDLYWSQFHDTENGSEREPIDHFIELDNVQWCVTISKGNYRTTPDEVELKKGNACVTLDVATTANGVGFELLTCLLVICIKMFSLAGINWLRHHKTNFN